MFIVGQTYENRRGRYKVLAIRGDKLTVEYEDGTTATLDIPLQTRIINRRQAEKGTPVTTASSGGSTGAIVHPWTYVNWDRYDLWNDAVFRHFFGEDQLGRLVYIDVDDEILTNLAPDSQAKGDPIRDFVEVLRRTLSVRGSQLVDNHLGRARQWKQEGSPAPAPFVALLSLFCLAAQRMQSDQKFTANNYYDRLAQVLFGSRYSGTQRKALTSGMQKVDLLWNELDGWLWSQGWRYGRPSAQPMYKLAHVGWPLSQALLRSHDRQRLPGFFREAGLEAGQDLPASDMEDMLKPWVPASSLSQAAKASWRDGAARRRMAEVASLELSMWDGATPAPQQATGYTPNRHIVLEASLLKGPRPRIDWGVVLPLPPGSASAICDFGEEGRGLGIGPQVTVHRGIADGWSEPVSDIRVEHLLVNQIRMVADGGYECNWRPRKVIVLAWDDGFQTYRSKPHMEFGRRSIVLVYKTVVSDVEGVLGPVHDGGMSRIPDPWGVPEDWVAFKDVRLTARPDTGGAEDLAALEPEISLSVEWGGGISLPGRKTVDSFPAAGCK